MFIIDITYKKSLEEIEKVLADHRNYLETGYQKNYFVASGPKNPRNGGIIISQLQNRQQLEDFLKEDPYILQDVAEYKIIEFNPVKYHQDFAAFMK